MDKLKMQTPNIADGKFAALAALFPNAITETIDENGEVVRAIDADVLAQEINNRVVSGKEERYQFTWPDKKKSVLLANAPIAATLRPCREESVDFVNTENLYIEGDNLDVLKLLRETYLNRVKMIYIDPPYNTGKDFIYEDDFAEETGEFLRRDMQYDEQGNRLTPNLDSNGRFHTDWLNMIYPRLRIARDLLTDDGVIFISIDDNEVENLKKVCNEVFGSVNFVGQIVVKSNPRGSQSESQLAGLHEYIIVFSKNIQQSAIIGHQLSEEMESEYKYSENGRAYRLLGLRQRGGFWRRSERPNLYFPIFANPTNGNVSLIQNSEYTESVLPIQPSTGDDGSWRWSKEKIKTSIDELIAKPVRRNGEDVWDIFQKDFLDRGAERRTKAKSLWEEKEINYQNGTIEVKELLVSGAFDYAKPVYLVKRCIEMLDTSDNPIILDFFSGSSTTAHAVMQLNAEDGGKRKFIMVQLPVICTNDSEAYKAGFKNICDIGKERIRRAGKKIKEDNKDKEGIENLDTGFRVLILDSSNMKDVYYTPVGYAQMSFDLEGFMDNIKPDRSDEDLLFQVMLDLGIPLSAKIKQDGNTFNVDDNYLIACFGKVDTTLITEIAKKKPYYAVFRDSSFLNDSAMVNFEQVFSTYSPSTIRRVL
ncbi:site-specific DNA-methyltransferase [Heliobacillus mobilis]|uniref:Site-specific DNA-methyltransferase n=1 Tax=Heliobacterium mobile TaxID=28064 RepID=A0A6I3SNE4_HELMO|nr:site-specific DNA-methyltransferase [Heliobacterium mobile]MTV50508.1 site-specific DNA-methyltransferase [Heliobacterium mobile]